MYVCVVGCWKTKKKKSVEFCTNCAFKLINVKINKFAFCSNGGADGWGVCGFFGIICEV